MSDTYEEGDEAGQSPEEILDGSMIQQSLSTDQLVQSVYENVYNEAVTADPELAEVINENPEILQDIWAATQEVVAEQVT